MDTSNGYIELAEFITPETVEVAHGKAIRAHERGLQQFADVGWRAALARDNKLLLALEKGAEMIDKIAENQQGRTKRSSDNFHETIEFTEPQLWKEAYRLCDEGQPIRNFEWIYGAAAWLCGYNT
jgi:hypothetical protein